MIFLFDLVMMVSMIEEIRYHDISLSFDGDEYDGRDTIS